MRNQGIPVNSQLIRKSLMAEGEHCPLPYPAQPFTAAGTDPLGLPEASPGSSKEKALASTQELPPGSAPLTHLALSPLPHLSTYLGGGTIILSRATDERIRPCCWDLVPVATLSVMASTTTGWLQQSRVHRLRVEEMKEDNTKAFCSAAPRLPRSQVAEEAQLRGLLCSPETQDRSQTDNTYDRHSRRGNKRGIPSQPCEQGLQHPLPSTPDELGRAVPLCSYLPVLAQAALYLWLHSTLHDFPCLLGMPSHTATAEQIPNNISPITMKEKAWWFLL